MFSKFGIGLIFLCTGVCLLSIDMVIALNLVYGDTKVSPCCREMTCVRFRHGTRCVNSDMNLKRLILPR